MIQLKLQVQILSYKIPLQSLSSNFVDLDYLTLKKKMLLSLKLTSKQTELAFCNLLLGDVRIDYSYYLKLALEFKCYNKKNIKYFFLKYYVLNTLKLL